MTTRFQRFGLVCYALALPLFPSFVTLEALTPAGLNIIPRPVVLGLVATFGLLAVAQAPGVFGRLRSPVGGSLALLLGLLALSAILGYDPAGSLFLVALLASTAMVHLGAVAAFAEGSGERCFLVPFLLSGTLAVLGAVLMAVSHHPAALFALAHGRAVGTFLHPGELAGYTLLLTPVGFGAARFGRLAATRAAGLAGGLFGLLGLVASFSRAAWVAAILAAIFAALAFGRGRVRWVAVAALLAGVLAFGLAGERHHNPDEDYARLAAWRAGIRAVQAAPLLGSGPATFWRLYPSLRPPDGYADLVHPHDVLLTVASEGGLAGLAAFVALWWRFTALVRGGLARCGERGRGMVLAIATGLVATWIQGMVDLVTVVFVALWIPFMGAALGWLEEPAP